ncbi:hypothetical protein ACIRLA_15565 [Streptomyces sp. NPDC102364]|uniref:hypothetical protein n=1 Tax=Streptomyces sp. NPDC102364 TaxID=3366161 RepID=UPI003806EC30
MTFVEKNRLIGGHTEQAMLKIAWEGEIYGVGMFEAVAEKFPEHADHATAVATMEWLNVHLCEDFGHAAGVSVSLEQAEKLGREGAEMVRKHSFEHLVKAAMRETPVADKLYAELGKHARTPELKAFADDLMVHEPALRDWLKSEQDGNSDGAEKIFAYLERHGISRKEAVIPRKDREGYGGDKQQLVLAFFPSEDLADEAAMVLKNWDKATEYMRLDSVGVLAKDKNGTVKEHKLGKRAGKKGMGIGVALGVVAAIPTGGLSLLGAGVGGLVGGGLIGDFFHKGLKMTEEDTARIGGELDAGHAAVGVLAWDFEARAVTDKLRELGGTPQAHEVAELPEGPQS